MSENNATIYTRLVGHLCLLWITIQCILILIFTNKYWDLPWPDSILTIDGNSYQKGAIEIAAGNGIEDAYHSPGYQAFLGLLLKLSGSMQAAIHWNKTIFVLMFIASVIMLWRGGRRWFSRDTSALAAAILSSSLSMRYYSNMIQYEVLVAFLILAWILLVTRKQTTINWKQYLIDFLSALLLSMVIWIQIRYLPLVIIPILQFFSSYMHHKNADCRSLFFSTLVRSGLPLFLISVWSLFISIKSGYFIFGMTGSEFRFNTGNNSNATGESFPYPPISEPSGWSFILNHPGNFIWLVGQRFLYLWGIKPDIWVIPPRSEERSWFEFYERIIACVIFFCGWIGIFYKNIKYQMRSSSVALHLALILVLVPPLFIFGSHRFILPVLPIICLFQAYFLESLTKIKVNR